MHRTRLYIGYQNGKMARSDVCINLFIHVHVLIVLFSGTRVGGEL